MSFYDRLLYEAMLERRFLWAREADDNYFPRYVNTGIRPRNAERLLMVASLRQAERHQP